MVQVSQAAASTMSDDILVGKAVAQAGERLGLRQNEIASIIGISTAQMSKVNSGGKPISGKARELALYLIRVFRSLDAITGGDAASTRAWMRNENLALGGVPAERLKEAAGLVDVMNYLDASRAPL